MLARRTLSIVLLFSAGSSLMVEAVPAKKAPAENHMISKLSVKNVQVLIKKGITLIDLKKKLKVMGFKNRGGIYTRYFLSDGAVDIPQKLKKMDEISGHKFGYKKKQE